jgi:hypothetical protein
VSSDRNDGISMACGIRKTVARSHSLIGVDDGRCSLRCSCVARRRCSEIGSCAWHGESSLDGRAGRRRWLREMESRLQSRISACLFATEAIEDFASGGC